MDEKVKVKKDFLIALFIPYYSHVINKFLVAVRLNLHCKKFILATLKYTNASGFPSTDAALLMRRASLYSLVTGSVLVVLKAAAWMYTDSLSLMSSLADSMLDVIASSLNFVAIRYALQPADDEHRFGHGKAEDLATLAQSIFIAGSGLFLVIEGIRRILNPARVSNGSIGIAVMGISIVMSLTLVYYQRRVAAQTGSGLIASDAMHYFIDFLTNAGVIVALVVSMTLGWKLADPVIAIVIAAYIMYGAFQMSMSAFNNLMDHEFSDEERTEIERMVRAHPEVAGLHELRTRKSGIHRFIQFHLDLDGTISLRRAHAISDEVEDSLLRMFPNTEILIHQDAAEEQEQHHTLATTRY